MSWRKNVRPSLAAAIDELFPDEVVEPLHDWDEKSWLCDRYKTVKAKLTKIKAAEVFAEIGPTGNEGFLDCVDEEPEFDEDGICLEEDSPNSSYHTFVVRLKGREHRERFEDEIYVNEDGFETVEDADGKKMSVQGEVSYGLSVALSVLWPVAMVVHQEFRDRDECPELGTPFRMHDCEYYDMQGELKDPGEILRDDLANNRPGIWDALGGLYEEIVAALSGLKIECVNWKEGQCVLPGLRADSELLHNPDHSMRLQDVFFFQHL